MSITDQEKIEFERLRKNMPWMRAFARDINQIMTRSNGESAKAKVGAAQSIIRTYSGQWPNWLDKDIEKMIDEKEEQP